MRLLYREAEGAYQLKNFRNDVPPYAILSHTWGSDEDEVTYKDIESGSYLMKKGHDKINFCGEQAAKDGFGYFWIDTCCINRTDGAELSESITSMFQWYKRAAKCYVYLSDVSKGTSEGDEELQRSTWKHEFRKSKWFTRCWTLQELLAPDSVEFFSSEGLQLGNKASLQQMIHDITKIPIAALQGALLSQFSIKERMSWTKERDATKVEDKAYSLVGIFDISMTPRYGEGVNASVRLQRKIDNLTQDQEAFARYQKLLRVTNPRDDKTRIETDKGGLQDDVYQWILQSSEFQLWSRTRPAQLLWIRGDPGKGKTMLLCGIINHLKDLKAKNVIYFFFQATDSRINNAMAALRSLIYLLLEQQPSRISYLQQEYGQPGDTLSEDANTWYALSRLLEQILQDTSLQDTDIILDALDECITDLDRLLILVTQLSKVSSKVKVIVSSRNWPIIETGLRRTDDQVELRLELNESSVSTAVGTYIDIKVKQLAIKRRYDERIRDFVRQYLIANARGTFLWVALVCKVLDETPKWRVRQKLEAIPPGLEAFYQRMMEQISGYDPDDTKLCTDILAIVSLVYRPITLIELAIFLDPIEELSADLESLTEIVSLCGSFLSLREGTVSFIHQSAKDFLLDQATSLLFPSGKGAVHQMIYSRSLKSLSSTLRRDMYELNAPGFPIESVKRPDPDPLAATRYSCMYWTQHLRDPTLQERSDEELYDDSLLHKFLREHYLYWLEALSLLRSVSEAVVEMICLNKLFRGQSSQLADLVRDGTRFIQYFKWAIENYPLQIYNTGSIFSPTQSIIRSQFRKEDPKWIVTKPIVANNWSACLYALEGHTDIVRSVAFSPDGSRVVSGSDDSTARIWDIQNGTCQHTLEGHTTIVISAAFSPDGSKVVSSSWDGTVRIWDTQNGACMNTLKGHTHNVSMADFSPDGSRVVSGSHDETIRIWDTQNGACLHKLEGHTDIVSWVAFSPDGSKVVSSSADFTARIWDTQNGTCLHMLEDHTAAVYSAVFSPDGSKVVSGSYDGIVRIWDTQSRACLNTLKGHTVVVTSVVFSPDGLKVVSSSYDGIVRIWDTQNGACLHILEGHTSTVLSAVFSPDGLRVASGSHDSTIRIWDAQSGACLNTLEGHTAPVPSVVFSPDGLRVVSGSFDGTVRTWDTQNDASLNTLEGHTAAVSSIVFSPDCLRVVSGSDNGTVRIWDTQNGACLHKLEGHTAAVPSVVFSPDGLRVVSGSFDGTVRTWDTQNDACLNALEGHTAGVSSIIFSPDCLRVVSGSFDGTVRIWDTQNGACLHKLEGHTAAVPSIVFSPDGLRVVSGSFDGTVRVWDTQSRACLHTLNIHTREVYARDVSSIAISTDGLKVVSGSFDYTARIWDTENGACLHKLEGHTDIVRWVAFSPDGLKVVSGSDDGTVRIWDTQNGACLHKLEGHTGLVISAVFSPDGSKVVSGSFDFEVCIWDTQSGACLKTLRQHTRDVHSVASKLTSSSVTLVTPELSTRIVTRWEVSDNWVEYNDNKALWLPPDYRIRSSSVSPRALALGCRSGRVLIIQVKEAM